MPCHPSPSAPSSPSPPLHPCPPRLVHRQNPERFVNYCLAVHSNRADPSAAQAFAFGCFSRRNQRHWDTRAGGDQPAWPPPRPGSPGDLTRVAVQPHAQQHDMAGQLVGVIAFGGGLSRKLGNTSVCKGSTLFAALHAGLSRMRFSTTWRGS